MVASWRRGAGGVVRSAPVENGCADEFQFWTCVREHHRQIHLGADLGGLISFRKRQLR